MSHPYPTVSLQNLFNDLDFLALAERDQKPCFRNRYYVNRGNLYGSVLRFFDGEKQSVSGNNIIIHICKNASETYSSYEDNEYFGDILMRKIVNARQGLERISETYKQDGKLTVSNEIRNSIMILDIIIPDNIKEDVGIILPSRNKSDDI